jgi:hypothetical protein
VEVVSKWKQTLLQDTTEAEKPNLL